MLEQTQKNLDRLNKINKKLTDNKKLSFNEYKFIIRALDFSNEFKNWLLTPAKNSVDKFLYENYDLNTQKVLRESLAHELDYYLCLEKVLSISDFSGKFDIETIHKERDLNLRILLNSLYDKESNTFIVNESFFKRKTSCKFHSFSEYCSYVNANFKNANLLEFNFDDIDLSKYDLNDALINSIALKKLNKYDDAYYKENIITYPNNFSIELTTSYETEAHLISHDDIFDNDSNGCNQKFYYISDLHLNHKILNEFPCSATKEEIIYFIKKIVRKMVSSAKKAIPSIDDEFLLIAGDVSFNFNISEIFYSELAKLWTPTKIIVVLGNHELWDFNNQGIKVNNASVDEIIAKYRAMLKRFGIILLHNEFLIHKRISAYDEKRNITILNEHDLINNPIIDLQKMLLDSDFSILGGIGFSGYSEDFNAESGLYRATITDIEDDKEQTLQFESIYNRLLSHCPNDNIIVLTHTNIESWTKQEFHPNWIYVNGHTHRNKYEHSENCKLYADNQIGYHSKNFGLKFFRKSIKYDIFKNFTDGIYKISKDDYLDFYAGICNACTFKSDIDYLIMLKREGIYLFLLEDKEKERLYIMNGGTKNRLKNTSINYYYENMVKFSDFIKLSLNDYNSALKSISQTVKNIGGDGTIHGCIVDINYFNHIYLHPNDGTITTYYSPFFGYRLEYSDVKDLLQERCPNMLPKYMKLLNSNSNTTIINKNDLNNSTINHILDTTQYKPSNLIKRLQYITENNIIRIWSDDLINGDLLTQSYRKLLSNKP